MTAPSKPSSFSAIDGMRGVAAIAVFAFHSAKATGEAFWPASGYLAVDLFFLLSGMVIAYSYDGRIESGALNVRRFITIRIIRFYPIYLLGAVLAVLLLLYSIKAGRPLLSFTPFQIAESFVLTLLFIPQHLGDSTALFPLVTPYWSLFFELVINLVFVVFWRWLSLRTLLGLVAASGIALIWLADPVIGVEGGHTWSTIPLGLARVMFSFFLGVVIVRHTHRFAIKSDGAVLAAMVVLAATLSINPGTWQKFYDLICVIIVFPIFGLLAMRYEAGSAIAPIAKGIGDASYGVYALHAPANGIAFGLLAMAGLSVDLWAPYSFIVVATCLIIAVLGVDRYYDRPVRRWLTKNIVKAAPV